MIPYVLRFINRIFQVNEDDLPPVLQEVYFFIRSVRDTKTHIAEKQPDTSLTFSGAAG